MISEWSLGVFIRVHKVQTVSVTVTALEKVWASGPPLLSPAKVELRAKNPLSSACSRVLLGLISGTEKRELVWQ